MDLRTVKWIVLAVSVSGFFMAAAWGWIAWEFGMGDRIMGHGGVDPASVAGTSPGVSLLGCELLAGFSLLLGILGLVVWILVRRRLARAEA